MSVARVSLNQAQIDEVRERCAQRGTTDHQPIGQCYELGAGVTLQLGNDWNAPPMVYEIDQRVEVAIPSGCAHLTKSISSIKIVPL